MATKPDTPAKEGGAAGALTSRDFELLLAAFECNKNEFIVDYKKYAEKCGLSNANSGKASWHGLKKKLDKMGVAPKGAATPTPGGEETPKASATKGKKRKAADADNAGDEEGKATPAAKKGKRGKKNAPPATKNSADGNGAAGGEVKGEDMMETEV